MRVAYGNAHFIEVVVQFLVVGTEIDDACALLAHEILYRVVVIALVFAADDEYRRSCHALQRVPASVDIRCF